VSIHLAKKTAMNHAAEICEGVLAHREVETIYALDRIDQYVGARILAPNRSLIKKTSADSLDDEVQPDAYFLQVLFALPEKICERLGVEIPVYCSASLARSSISFAW
jgi:hypothetical protein